MDGCEPLCRYQELNPGPLQERLFLTTELPLQPSKLKFKVVSINQFLDWGGDSVSKLAR